MRLLRRTHNGELSITNDIVDEDAIPPYAILSHTWGAEADEVTFDDLASGSGKTKPGYRKARFCGEQAWRDGLEHFWVDTCCIHKANKAELSHAINSMFRWYRNASRCYVYLADVSSRTPAMDKEESHPPLWELEFRRSRWFTRGWTLQELLAPDVVEFFAHDWERLGDKTLLCQKIHEITGISKAALQGAPLTQFNVEERLSWNVHRHTKLEEDRVYSLLGIFDVYLSPFYGEGASKARDRLTDQIDKRNRCMQDLRDTDPRNDKKRIEETKGGLLTDSYRWILDNASFEQWLNKPQSRLLWIKGDPGKGKTMLLCGIIDELQSSMHRTALLSYFFCQATDSRINSATAVLRGLLYMLVSEQPSLVLHVRKTYDHVGKNLFEDANAWVALTEIFTDVLQDPNLKATYLIIDALDECVIGLPMLLNFVSKQSSASSRIKWIVSSRNWPVIEERLDQVDHKVKLSLELNTESVSAAVSVYIKQKVSQLAQHKKYDEQTKDAVLKYLMTNAHDTFLWVALVCQSLEATSKRHALKKLSSFPSGLDSLYERMMQQVSKSDDAELCKQLLASLALVYQPVTLQELTVLVEQLDDLVDDTESIREVVGLCGSFLTLQEETVYFVHQSAKEFLLANAAGEVFPRGREDVHHTIFARSLQNLSMTLHRDMYSLKALGHLIEDVRQPDPNPLAASRYSCVYWVDHLCDSHPISSVSYADDIQDNGVLDVFLKEKYLYWLETLSLCMSMPKGALSMTKLLALVQGCEKTTLLTELVYDARRFLMYHKGAIERSPLQAYASALLFSPTASLVRKLFQHEEPKWITIKSAMGDGWSACLQTLEGHSRYVNSVAFSHDSTLLASASSDRTVKLWDADSGECLQTLRGHNHSVISVTFSHDSAWLASASHDNTIKIWDTSSGACLQTLKGHSSGVISVAFSHDSAQLASASGDITVRIWDASSGACLQTLEDHSDFVSSVTFSHDSAWLASASHDNTIKIWDASSGACLQTLRGHSDILTSVAFSHDSMRLVSASNDSAVKIWDTNSGACLQTLKGHSSGVISVAFSHDSTRLASASDNTIKIWDASSGACLQTLEGHSEWVSSVALSHDSTRLVSASGDNTVKIWDVRNDKYIQTPRDHSNDVYSMTFSHDSTRLASGSKDCTIKIWDASNGACLQMLEGHNNHVTSVAFSHDSAQLASASMDWTVKIWNVNSGGCLQTLKGHGSTVNLIAFSHDSTRLASASRDNTVKIWNASSGACLQTLEGHREWISSVALSHDSTRLASASYDNRVKIWDTNNGTCLQTLNIGRKTSKLSFDPTSSCLYTEIGTIVIRNSEVSTSIGVIAEPQRPTYLGPGLSSDSIWIKHAGNNILWVPSEYRPSCSSVCGTLVGIGAGSGRVWTCRIDL